MLFIHTFKYSCFVYSSIHVLIHLHLLASLSVYVLLIKFFICQFIHWFIYVCTYVRMYACMYVQVCPYVCMYVLLVDYLYNPWICLTIYIQIIPDSKSWNQLANKHDMASTRLLLVAEDGKYKTKVQCLEPGGPAFQKQRRISFAQVNGHCFKKELFILCENRGIKNIQKLNLLQWIAISANCHDMMLYVGKYPYHFHIDFDSNPWCFV